MTHCEDRLDRCSQLATSSQLPSYEPGSVQADFDRPIAECLADFAAEPDEYRAERRSANPHIPLAQTNYGLFVDYSVGFFGGDNSID